eukprot:TRINITY_DN39422_c0_g1_i1.p1 TRINITY_DN39422_c0_g1~~TRINITY_DN39422_c0_g1_i1.p1  ORF type:complete len:323 (-),score=60.91 TRINITY_DN39422_c0_g1_i1:160-1128(-)
MAENADLAVVDAALADAGGVLHWRRLRSIVAKKLLRRKGDSKRCLMIRSLACIPDAYLSTEDEFVRLPSSASSAATTGSSAAPADLIVAAAATTVGPDPTWALLGVLDAALAAAPGHKLPWKRVRDLLVAEELERRLGTCERKHLTTFVLSNVPDSYVSRDDEYVRLPVSKRPRIASSVSCEQILHPPSLLTPCRGSKAMGTGESADDASLATRPSIFVTPCVDVATFDDELRRASDTLVVVAFSAVWCGPCARIKPEYRELAEELDDIVFLEVDVDQNSTVADRLGISGVPTFAFFRKGEMLGLYDGVDIDQLTLHIIKHK